MAGREEMRPHWPAVASVGFAALCAISLFLTANALFNIGAMKLGFGFPYSSFLSPPSDRFADFFKVILSYPGAGGVRPGNILGLHDLLAGYIAHNPYFGVGGFATGDLTHFHLPPLTTMFCLTAAALMHYVDPATMFIALVVAMLFYLARISVLIGRTWRNSAIWALLGVLNYPMLMLLDRGNLFAGITALMIIHALILAIRGKAPLFAGLLLALAVNVRPNAILFVVPLLILYPARERRLVACALLSAILICAASLLLDQHLYPDYGLAHFRQGVETYYRIYVVGYKGVDYGSSLYGCAKLLIGYHPDLDSLCAAMFALLCLAAAIAYRFERLDRAAFLFLICAGYCLGSSVFADYHLLIFLIVPMVQAMDAPDDGGTTIFSLPFLASCVMLSPKNYLFAQGISYQVLFNPLFLLIAAAITLLTVFRAKETDQPSPDLCRV